MQDLPVTDGDGCSWSTPVAPMSGPTVGLFSNVFPVLMSRAVGAFADVDVALLRTVVTLSVPSTPSIGRTRSRGCERRRDSVQKQGRKGQELCVRGHIVIRIRWVKISGDLGADALDGSKIIERSDWTKFLL